MRACHSVNSTPAFALLFCDDPQASQMRSVAREALRANSRKAPCREAVILVVLWTTSFVLIIDPLNIFRAPDRPGPSPSSCRHPPAPHDFSNE
jgi:hypothetical protein